MAAERLLKAGNKNGYTVKVETQGSIGAENVLSEKDINETDIVIIAADINVDMMRFSGKKVFSAKSIDAIKNSTGLIGEAYAEGTLSGAKYII